MISGPAPERPVAAGSALLRLLAAASLLAGCAWSGDALAAISFGRVLHDLAAVRSVRVPFTETRHLAILTRPLVLHGTLIYRRPGFLEKKVTSPTHQRFTLDGNRITMVDAQGRRRTLSLGIAPAVAELVDGYRALLRGNRKALEFNYWTRFKATGDHWQLRLDPKARNLRQVISHVAITGTGGRITRITTVQANGDRSVMRLQAPAAGGG